MKMIHAILIAFAMLFIGVAHAAPPSVLEVEKTIASGDYTKAKSQLEEVLKVNPDSIVATKYMLEIVRIENARDNQPSVEYKLYEDRLAKLEQAKAERIALAKKIQDEKEYKARMVTMWKVIFSAIFIFAFGFGMYFLVTRLQHRAEIRRQEQIYEDWCVATENDLVDLGAIIERARNRTYANSRVSEALAALDEDNADALGTIKARGVINQEDIRRHIYNARTYLTQRCGERF